MALCISGIHGGLADTSAARHLTRLWLERVLKRPPYKSVETPVSSMIRVPSTPEETTSLKPRIPFRRVRPSIDTRFQHPGVALLHLDGSMLTGNRERRDDVCFLPRGSRRSGMPGMQHCKN